LIFQDNYSVRRVYWASQETTAVFQPLSTNTAGSFDLATEGVLICGKASRGQTLLWTNVDLWTMTYIGSDLVYSFAKVGTNCGIVGPHAVVVLDTGAYWMSDSKFFVFDGFVKPIPCEVQDYVFGNFSSAYSYKVWALANPQFGEVTWFYPSGGASECDSYVTYNYIEGHWCFGSVSRSTGVTRRAGATFPVPVMIDSSGNIYDHETGTTHAGSTPFLESGPFQVSDGDNVVKIQRIVPDDKTAGDVSATIYTSLFPDAAETTSGPYPLSSATSVRIPTARQARIRLDESVANAWRVGTIRLGVIVGGRR
jgi:hypothetical protein